MSQKIIKQYYRLECLSPSVTWFARVPSESNPADPPSRGELVQAAKLFNAEIVELKDFESEVVKSLMSWGEVQTTYKLGGMLFSHSLILLFICAFIVFIERPMDIVSSSPYGFDWHLYHMFWVVKCLDSTPGAQSMRKNSRCSSTCFSGSLLTHTAHLCLLTECLYIRILCPVFGPYVCIRDRFGFIYLTYFSQWIFWL